MDKFLSFLRHFTWKRMLLAVVLTTVATAIIKPYFFKPDTSYNIPFWYLWVRLFVVAAVMLIIYIVSGVLHARFQPKRITLGQIQFVALVAGAVIGTITSGLVIGRSLTEMITNQAMFWGMVIFIGAGIAISVVTSTLLVYRE